MAFAAPTTVTQVQDTPNLVYKIVCQYQNYDPQNPDIFTWPLPFQLGAVEQTTTTYSAEAPDPDEVWAVVRFTDLSFQAPSPNPDATPIVQPLIQIQGNGVPPPGLIREAFLVPEINAQDGTTIVLGFYAVEYYLKWYKQAEGGTDTFGLTPVP